MYTCTYVHMYSMYVLMNIRTYYLKNLHYPKAIMKPLNLNMLISVYIRSLWIPIQTSHMLISVHTCKVVLCLSAL